VRLGAASARPEPVSRPPSPWTRSTVRAELLALYAEADALLDGWTCACSASGVGSSTAARCCHFALTGREPYPTAVEIEEVRHAARAASLPLRDLRRLPQVDLRTCPLLGPGGRCRVYASRPFGCRTYFCDSAEAPYGASAKLPRRALASLGRRIADLSARFAPLDPHPRPLLRALAQDGRAPR